MKKGLVLALTVVAIASIQVQTAQAGAPVIDEIFEVIISDGSATQPATGSGVFVFYDALDLDDLAVDDDTASTAIKWSYSDASGSVRINDADPITVEDPTDPPAANRIDLNDDPGAPSGGGGESIDGNMRTATFRDVVSVYSGEPAGTVLNDVIVTLFASDCTTYSQESFNVRTVVGVTDTVSKEDIVLLYDIDFVNNAPTGANAWTGFVVSPFTGGSVFDNTGEGLCMDAPLTGGNFPAWRSPDGFIDIVDGSIYRATVTLNLTAPASPAVGTIPVLEAVMDNFFAGNPAGTNTWQSYNFVRDFAGGANQVGNLTNNFSFMLGVNAVGAAGWSAFLGNPANDALADGRAAFRLNDTSPTLGSETDVATICIERLVVERFDVSVLGTPTQSFNVPVTSTDFISNGTANIGTAPVNNFLNPGLEVALDPGTLGTADQNRVVLFAAPGGDASNAGIPLQWNAGMIYATHATMRYANAADLALTPPNVIDAILMVQASSRFEIGGFWSSVRGTGAAIGVAIPDATSQMFSSYLYGQQGTLSLVANDDRIRGSVQYFETGLFGNGGASQTGTLITEGFSQFEYPNP